MCLIVSKKLNNLREISTVCLLVPQPECGEGFCCFLEKLKCLVRLLSSFVVKIESPVDVVSRDFIEIS